MIDTNTLLDLGLLLLRIVVAIIFFSSGKSHALHPAERSESIGLPEQATLFLGVVEMTGAVSIALGIFIEVGAILLILVMLGAIYKKIFTWKTGFYSDKGFGWHYDLLLLSANLVFLAEGGRFVLIG